MFRIKICGLTRPEDAAAAAQAGADAIGLNFAPPSPRAIEVERAQEIAAAVGPGVLKVGVFVNASAEAILACAAAVPLDAVQLHGDEPPEMLLELGDLPVIKAFRLRDGDLNPITSYIGGCRKLRRMPSAVLIDAYSPDARGGTGQIADWSSAEHYGVLAAPSLPGLILAGGLTADNVALAIAQVRPFGVDTASGVESSPGVKDLRRMAAFIAAARQALNL